MSRLKLSHPAVRAAYAAVLAVSLCAVAAYAAGPAPAPSATPDPRILVIDRGVILRASKAGKGIMAQLQAFTSSAQNEFKAQGEALRKEGEALKAQVAILAPDVKARKIRDFQAKEAAFQKKVQNRQAEIQGGLYQARQQVERALDPLLHGIMAERHANLLLDRNSVVLGTVDVDITAQVVQRLDQKLPNVTVKLQPLPPQLQAQFNAQLARESQQQSGQ